MRPDTEAAIERVRAICVALPKVVESGGVASGVGALSGTVVFQFKVSRRVVARLFVLDPGGREDLVLWIRADPGEREVLLNPSRRSFPAGPREVAITLGADTDWTEIAEVVTDSFLLMAPKQLAADVEAALRHADDDA
jgi:hypothetical protein